MSTNYYKKRILSRDEKEFITSNLDKIKLVKGSLQYVLTCEDPDVIPTSIHLGRNACGWQFLFDHNNWKYYNDLASFVKFIYSDGWIEDEYGREISPKDFIDIVYKSIDRKIDDFGNLVDGYYWATDFA